MKRSFLTICMLVIVFATSKLLSSDNIVIIQKNGECLDTPISEIKSISHDYDKGEIKVNYNNGSVTILQIGDTEGIEFSEYSEKDISNSLETISDYFATHNFYSDAVNDLDVIRSMKCITDATANDGVIHVTVGNKINLSKSYVDTEYYDIKSVSNIASLQTISFGNSKLPDYDDYYTAREAIAYKTELCLNKSVLIINALANDTKSSEKRYSKEIEELARIFKENQFKVKVIDGDNVTVDTYLKEMPEYGITFILAHGENHRGTHYLQTGQKRNIITGAWDYFYNGYDYMNTGNDIYFQKIREDKLNEMNNFKDPNSIVFIISCEILDDNDNIWQIMKNKGLGGCYGYHGVDGQTGIVGVEGALQQAKELALSLTRGKSTYGAYNALQWRTDFISRVIDNPDLLESRSMFLEYKGNNIIFNQDSEKWLKMTFDMTKDPDATFSLYMVGLKDAVIKHISGASPIGDSKYKVDPSGNVTITYSENIESITGFDKSSILSFECNDTIKSIDSNCFSESSLSVFNCNAVKRIYFQAFNDIPIKRLDLREVETISGGISFCNRLEYVSISGNYTKDSYGIISHCDSLKEVKFDGLKLRRKNSENYYYKELDYLLISLFEPDSWHKNPPCGECGEYEHLNAPTVYIPAPILTEVQNYLESLSNSHSLEFFKQYTIGNGHKHNCSHYKERVTEYNPNH